VRIETERLIVRGFVPEDVYDLHEILGDTETMRFSEPPYDLPKTECFLRDFCIQRNGAIAACLRDSGKVIGYILFNRLDDGEYEVGWFFNRAYWHKGYAFEAVSAVIEHAFSEIGARRVFAETIDLKKSVPLMKKLGMKFESVEKGEAVGPDGKIADMQVYAIERDN